MSHARFCKRCKAEIPAARVAASPETELCKDCCEAVGGEFDVYVVPENLAKEGGLRKNYGGYKIQKRRKDIRPQGE